MIDIQGELISQIETLLKWSRSMRTYSTTSDVGRKKKEGRGGGGVEGGGEEVVGCSQVFNFGAKESFGEKRPRRGEERPRLTLRLLASPSLRKLRETPLPTPPPLSLLHTYR
jgi:hypothetical protein